MMKKGVQTLTKVKQNPNLRGVNLEEIFTIKSKTHYKMNILESK
jgi:hypothetical protein